MLNSKKERELCYFVTIDEIKPIEGADRVEVAVVGGWKIMVRKGQFKAGDIAIYFEIDSKVPEEAPFDFLSGKHYKIKTQKYFKGTVISQGLIMAVEDFEGTRFAEKIPTPQLVNMNSDERFLTAALGVTYSVVEDNKRKGKSADKYAKMAQRNPALFRKKPIRFLMRHTWGKKILFLFLGKKGDKKGEWPEWVKKTDEERIQNMPWVVDDKRKFIATEKADGTSTTFSMRKYKSNFTGKVKYDFYVCSRNVVQTTPERDCYYDSNVYWEMAKKYDIENVLRKMLEDAPDECEWITIQGETFGDGIQKRGYLKNGEHDFKAFNLIYSNAGRANTLIMKAILEKYNIPTVPIIDANYIMPDTVDEVLTYADGESAIDGGMREGIVFRDMNGDLSFKAVSNPFLLKYH